MAGAGLPPSALPVAPPAWSCERGCPADRRPRSPDGYPLPRSRARTARRTAPRSVVRAREPASPRHPKNRAVGPGLINSSRPDRLGPAPRSPLAETPSSLPALPQSWGKTIKMALAGVAIAGASLVAPRARARPPGCCRQRRHGRRRRHRRVLPPQDGGRQGNSAAALAPPATAATVAEALVVAAEEASSSSSSSSSSTAAMIPPSIVAVVAVVRGSRSPRVSRDPARTPRPSSTSRRWRS